MRTRASDDCELTAREREVLALVARGCSTTSIAGELFVSPNTVRVHVRNILRKLNARTRAHAVAIALSTGLIQLEPRVAVRDSGWAGQLRRW